MTLRSVDRGPQQVGAGPLFSAPGVTAIEPQSPSQKAHVKAMIRATSRRATILRQLAICPMAIFELAVLLDVMDHQIAGRFSEMEREGLIFRPGMRRLNPRTDCHADTYDLTDAGHVVLRELEAANAR